MKFWYSKSGGKCILMYFAYMQNLKIKKCLLLGITYQNKSLSFKLIGMHSKKKYQYMKISL